MSKFRNLQHLVGHMRCRKLRVRLYRSFLKAQTLPKYPMWLWSVRLI
ncbi:hypothetical protein J2W97_005541 [Paenibacillus jamilae]|nr:hypothetical protein [Paenibacillus jamilae]